MRDPTVDLVRKEARSMLFGRHRYVTQDQLAQALKAVNERITQMSTSEQQQIDAITGELGTVQSGLAQVATDGQAAASTLQAEIDKLSQGGNPPANLDALKAAADALASVPAALDTQVQALGKLVPTPPAGS